jgi:hypothetical protein
MYTILNRIFDSQLPILRLNKCHKLTTLAVYSCDNPRNKAATNVTTKHVVLAVAFLLFLLQNGGVSIDPYLVVIWTLRSSKDRRLTVPIRLVIWLWKEVPFFPHWPHPDPWQTQISHEIFKLTSFSSNMRIVWDIAPCSLVVFRRFRGVYCSHNQANAKNIYTEYFYEKVAMMCVANQADVIFI